MLALLLFSLSLVSALEAMEVHTRFTILFLITLLILPNTLVLGRHAAQAAYSQDERHHQAISQASHDAEAVDKLEKRWRHGKPDTLQIAGSKLPDCSHACGSCLPCRLVMVSFICATIQEAETCPMAYKCMCNSKAYPVP